MGCPQMAQGGWFRAMVARCLSRRVVLRLAIGLGLSGWGWPAAGVNRVKIPAAGRGRRR